MSSSYPKTEPIHSIQDGKIKIRIPLKVWLYRKGGEKRTHNEKHKRQREERLKKGGKEGHSHASAKTITSVSIFIFVCTQVSLRCFLPCLALLKFLRNSAKVITITFALCSTHVSQLTHAYYLDRLLVQTSNRAGWLGVAQPIRLGQTQPNVKRKKKKEWVRPGPEAQPRLCLLRVCLEKHTLVPFPCILFSFCVDIWPNEPLFYIRKFQKYLGIFIDLFMVPSRVVFFFLCILFFYVTCSIYRLLLLNVNLLCNAFFPSCLKRVNKKGKQKRKA